jgi:tripartite-type tricarboxylate transporter receptor subunit TctC
MGELLGQQVVILNRDGATGVIGSEAVARAAPDGYTLLWGTSSVLAILPAFGRKLPFDPQRDFTPVSLGAKIAYILVVHPSLPAKNVKELIALAKARPGNLNYASAGTAGITHLTGELFKSMAGVDIVHVPYKGTAPAVTDMVSGQVELAFAGIATTLPLTKTNRLRALASTGTSRAELYPDLPTMSEAGLPGYEVTQWYAIVAPAKMPSDITAHLNSTYRKAVDDPEVQRRIKAEGGLATPSTPEELAAFIKSETVKYEKIVKTAGIKVD